MEDLWHAFNLIRVGDHITATTFRKIQRDSGVGAESEKIKLTLSIAVEDVDFDPQGVLCCACYALQQGHFVQGYNQLPLPRTTTCLLLSVCSPQCFIVSLPLRLCCPIAHHSFIATGGSIRLKGRNLVENEHVKLGAYHTLELEEHRAFTINKVCVAVYIPNTGCVLLCIA